VTPDVVNLESRITTVRVMMFQGGGIVDIESYRRRLLSLEQDLLKRLGREVEVARETRDDQAEIGDIAVVDELKEEYFAVAETDSVKLAQVRAALTRIEDGTFGLCVIDNEPIDAKRLDAVPWTPYCLKHQQELEEATRLRTPSL
jgi:DnaK suppressor protein